MAMVDEANNRLTRHRRRSPLRARGVHVRGGREDDPIALSFPLDNEQRNRVRDCLELARITPSQEVMEQLVGFLEGSISAFLANRREPDVTDREAHDELRELWLLASGPDPPVGQIRARVLRLPKKAIEYIDPRASHLIPRLFEGESADHGFLAWAGDADAHKLIAAVRTLSADGGRIVPGRSRGAGKRSRKRVEPVILGQVRGVGGEAHRGGRPRHAGQDRLVMYVAIDWYRATDQMPAPGRSDRTGFGDLVYSIFDWLEEPGATQALRRYWSEVRTMKSRPVPGGMEFS